MESHHGDVSSQRSQLERDPCQGRSGNKSGDLIAELSDPQEAQRRLAEDGLRKQTAAFNAENDPVSALFLTDAQKRLEAITAEREGHRIYSPVNGRVLLIRTHAIQNQNRTIAIKLLVREP